MDYSFDPDSNFFNSFGLNNATLFTLEKFKTMIYESNDIPAQSFNIRNPRKKLESLQILVEFK